MNCSRCDVEMKEGIAVPSPDEPQGLGWGVIPHIWPFSFQKVLKCPSCGKSLSEREASRK